MASTDKTQTLSQMVAAVKTFPRQWDNYMKRFAKVLSGGVVNSWHTTISYSDLTSGSAVSFGDKLPSGAIVRRCRINVTQAFTGNGNGSSTISLGLASAVDVKASAAVSGAPWSTTGLKDGIPVDTAATCIVLAADTALTATLTTLATDTALTAGSMSVTLDWVEA